MSYQYGYDRMDNIVTKATEHGPYTYNYDNLYRLSGAVSPVLPEESFTYDPVGNRLTSAAANNWTYNGNNELQSYNGASFQYDANGNTIQKNDNGATQRFRYNEDDRLTEVKDGNGIVIATYYYYPFGRRLWKEAGGVRTNFMYAAEGLIAEFDGAGSHTKAYGYAPNSIWTTDPLFMKVGGQYYFYHNDHMGTPQKLASASGAIGWSAVYDAFGKASVSAGSTVTNNLRFPGQYWDAETGLHYNWHRYYDPWTGGFLTVDPSLSLTPEKHIPFRIVGWLSAPQELSAFCYVRSNPIKFTDPEGLAIWVCSRKTTFSIGNHTYFWDDRNQSCCGMGSTQKCKENGPTKDHCKKVQNSDGKEDQLMKCCRDTADKGPWAPPINDCHEALDDCSTGPDLKNPGAPGGRLGLPCDKCDDYPVDIPEYPFYY